MHARRCRAIDTRTHITPSIRACARVWLQPNADGAADACARAHLGIRTRLDAPAPMQTHRCTDGHTTPPRTRTHTFTQTWIRYMHSYLYIWAHTYTYICKSCGRARPRRSRRALTRTYAHAPARRPVLYICSLTYTYGLTRRHTHIYLYIVTHS
jgi:hypothetical protein